MVIVIVYLLVCAISSERRTTLSKTDIIPKILSFRF